MLAANSKITKRPSPQDPRCQRDKTIWVALLFSLPLFSPLFAQNSVPSTSTGPIIKFESISLEQGLSQSTVRCILQDSKGFLWFGTADGLNRYDGYKFKVYKTDSHDPNGLSSSVIRTIYEDRSGMLWIGTEGGGLNEFDPATERFVRYQYDRNDPNSLSNNYVWSVCEDRTGKLWIGTDGGGLNEFDRERARFTRYQHDPQTPNSLSHNSILSVYEDRTGRLWIGTRGGGLNQFDRAEGRFVRYQFDPDNPNSLSNDQVWSICEGQSGALWVGTFGGGLNKLVPSDVDGSQISFIRYRHDRNNPNSLSHDRVVSIYQDRSGVLWIGTDGGGLNRLALPASSSSRSGNDGSTPVFQHYRNDPNDPNSLSNNHVWSLSADRTGVLWIGTEFGGVNKLDPYKEKFNHYTSDPHNPNSLNDKSVWSLGEDRAGNLWIGTRAGGLNKFDRKKQRFTHYQNDPDNSNSLSYNHVRAIYEDRSGLLWLGTDGGGLNSFDPKQEKFTRYLNDPNDPNSLSGNRVYSIIEDHSSVLWIGTRTGGLNRFDSDRSRFIHYQNDPNDSTSLSDNFVYEIYEDRSEVLWVGTFSGGLNRLVPGGHEGALAAFASYQTDPHDPNSLSNNCVLAIYEDRAGELWIATAGGGVNKFNRQTETFTRYTEENGLANDFVYGILEDEQGNLWLSTNKGLSRFNPQTETFQNYDVRDGVQSNEFNGGAYHKGPASRGGEMFFGGINGFNAFFPESIKDNPHVPPIFVTDFQIFNRSVGIGGDSPLRKHIAEPTEIVLSYKQNVFSFEFVALNYTIPEKNQYKYKLEGFDVDWVATGAANRTASYMNLSPGKYLFSVKGSNNDGVWNEEGATIKVTITPPFWETWWFRTMMALLVFGLTYAGYRRRLKTVRMKIELRAAHDAQMSIMPHSDPHVEGFDISGICLPANEVGGDFFDYMWLNEEQTKFGIVIGDVSGKAMQSAMTAVMSSGMIYAKANETITVKDIMTQINRPLYHKTDRSTFTALCLAALDLETRELTFTNAGLIEPLLKSGKAVVPLQATGTTQPLGLACDNVYQEKTMQLESGEVLVFVTDGIVEEFNHAKEFYGEDRLRKLIREMDTAKLSAKAIKEKIIAEVKSFSGLTMQDDDMTVVVVKVIG